MRMVIVESPFAAPTLLGRARNEVYARAALRDCMRRGEAPFASHLLYTQPGVLCDQVPEERELGISAGLAIGERADATVVYIDLGLSPGVLRGIEAAQKAGRPVEYRTVPGWTNTEIRHGQRNEQG